MFLQKGSKLLLEDKNFLLKDGNSSSEEEF
jgi:hypothetical protein